MINTLETWTILGQFWFALKRSDYRYTVNLQKTCMLNKSRKINPTNKSSIKGKHLSFHLRLNFTLWNWHHDLILSKATALDSKPYKVVCKYNSWLISPLQSWFWVKVPSGTIGKKAFRAKDGVSFMLLHRGCQPYQVNKQMNKKQQKNPTHQKKPTLNWTKTP